MGHTQSRTSTSPVTILPTAGLKMPDLLTPLLIPQWHLPLRWSGTADIRLHLRMDNGQLLPNDGHGSLQRLLAVVRALAITYLTACRCVFLRWYQRARRCCNQAIQCCIGTVLDRLGIRIADFLGVHAQDQHSVCVDLSLCHTRSVDLGGSILEGCQWRLRDGWASAEGMHISTLFFNQPC